VHCLEQSRTRLHSGKLWEAWTLMHLDIFAAMLVCDPMPAQRNRPTAAGNVLATGHNKDSDTSSAESLTKATHNSGSPIPVRTRPSSSRQVIRERHWGAVPRLLFLPLQTTYRARASSVSGHPSLRLGDSPVNNTTIGSAFAWFIRDVSSGLKLLSKGFSNCAVGS